MHILFDPDCQIDWDSFYIRQAQQAGFGLEAFQCSSNFQRGYGLASLFRTLFKLAVPIAKKAGATIGREALRTGTDIATDYLAGQDLATAAKTRARQGAYRLATRAQSHFAQTGSGRGPRRRKATSVGKKTRTKRKNSKRKASKSKAPAKKPAKRRQAAKAKKGRPRKRAATKTIPLWPQN